MRALLLSLLLAACTDGGPLLPARTADPPADDDDGAEAQPEASGRSLTLVEHADAVAAANLDGKGADELIYIRKGKIFLGDQGETPLADTGAQLQQVTRGDIDGDGDEEALLGFGAGRLFRDAEAQVWAVHADRAEKLWSETAQRAQVADLRLVDGQIFIAHFTTDRRVEGAWLIEGGLQVLGGANLGAAQVPLPDGDLLVGRLYGDEPRSDGDLQRLRGDDVVETLPSLRGVRALGLVELDGDPEPEVLVADGWHFQYGLHAVGHLRLLDGPGLKSSRTIALLEDSYTINDVEVVNHEDPRERGLLLTGAKGVHLLRRDGLGWEDVRLEEAAETANAVVVYRDDGPWALISGSPSTLIPLDL